VAIIPDRNDDGVGAHDVVVVPREDVVHGSGLLKTSAALSSIAGLARLEQPLLQLILDVIPADKGEVVLCDSAGDVAPPLTQQLLRRVTRDGVGVLVRGSDPSPRSGIAAPMVAFGRTLGVIWLTSEGHDRQLDLSHVHILIAIGSIAGVAHAHAGEVEMLRLENVQLRAEQAIDHELLGGSAAMRAVYDWIAKVAPTNSTVLLLGETGTGKELVARALHRNSQRAHRPFVAINCAALTETLLESELFGHERGAFTGAVALKRGKLEVADGGTVLLDEVGELPLTMQAKLLRVLEEREFERVGGTRAIRTDIRLIAATNRDLQADVRQQRWRADLYYRLNVVSTRLPSLRERREDIPVLAGYFAAKHADRAKRRVRGISAAARECLMNYDWPGNIRELENAIERAVVLTSSDLILPEDLPDILVDSFVAPTLAPHGYHAAIAETKKRLILDAMSAAEGNYADAAKRLGLHPTYLHRLITNLDLRGRAKW
jgi:two-component system response regulator HydG